jgi:hypothetical protein
VKVDDENEKGSQQDASVLVPDSDGFVVVGFCLPDQSGGLSINR